MLQIYFSLVTLLCLLALWAVQAQTVGHVYIYVVLCTFSILSVKVILPYSWLLAILLVAWWGLSVSPVYLNTLLTWLELLSLLIRRDVFYISSRNYIRLRIWLF